MSTTERTSEYSPTEAEGVEVPVARAVPGRLTRLWAALVLVGCVGVLGLAAWLDPAGKLYGTHQQFFRSGPCGMLVSTGLPCPTCGMTTSFAYFMEGSFGMSAYAQPAGFLLAIGTAVTTVLCAITAVTGRWPRTRVTMVDPYWLFMVILLILLAGWVFKIVSGLCDGSLPYPGGHAH